MASASVRTIARFGVGLALLAFAAQVAHAHGVAADDQGYTRSR